MRYRQQGWRAGAVTLAAWFLALCACSGKPPEERPPVRLNPWVSTAGRVEVGALVDRDTTRLLTLPAPVELVLDFPHEVELSTLKVYAGRQIRVVVGEAEPVDVESPEGWWAQPLKERPRGRSLKIQLRPTGPQAQLAELEVWGLGAPAAPRDERLLAEASRLHRVLPFENAVALPASPTSLALRPSGTGEPCGTVQVQAGNAPLRAARRAFVVYEAQGIQRSFMLRRSLNGRAPVGGLWLGGGNRWSTVTDELDPEQLTGRDSLLLCLPPESPHAVELRNPRLLLELDDGTNTLDRDAQTLLGAAYDNDLRTEAVLPLRRTTLRLSRPAELERAGLSLETVTGQLTVRPLPESGPREQGPQELAQGWNELPIAGAVLSALELDLSGAQPAELSVSEVVLVGSGVGQRVSAPRLVLTMPALRTSPQGEVGEHFGGRAYVAGWAESPQGPGVVEVDGAPVGTGDGSFGAALERQPGQTGPWSVTIQARFVDGTTLSRVVRLEDDRLEELRQAGAGGESVPAEEVARFGAEDQTAWAALELGKGGSVQLGTSVELEVPGGALKHATRAGITRKGPESVPPLDAGMVNVTAPANAAYRFSPPGQEFSQAVRVKLPYDERLLPEGIPPEQIQTFLFDPVAERWVPLRRLQVLRDKEQIVSETTHFSFMLNAVLVLPEHPGPVSFNPTSLGALKAADPAEGIDFIQPPEGNNQGTARTGLPLRLPRARGRYQPDLALVYDSDAGNGWLGVGWDLPLSRVSVDTRFGVPAYTGEEVYLWEGRMLLPVTAQGQADCLSGARRGRRYQERVAHGFHRILRCGTSVRDFHWEVTDKQGTVFIYGRSPEARLADPVRGNIAEWMLERVVDAYGNATLFDYFIDGKVQEPTAGPFASRNVQDWRRVYPRSIRSGTSVSGVYGSPSEPAWRVSFLREGEPGAPIERGDVSTSGRVGFKVATRFLLKTIRVELLASQQRGVIREYELDYEREHVGADGRGFGRSLLAAIRVRGAGTEFYTHRLEYYRPTQADRSFSAPVPWGFEAGSSLDTLALSDSQERVVRDATYVGLAPPSLPIKALSSGRSWSSTQGERRTLAQLVDVNGDGLPDRVRGSEVHFNQSTIRALRFSRRAPFGDPAALTPLLLNGGQALDLSRESLEGEESAWETHFVLGQGSVGESMLRSEALRVLMDADGDGRMDLVSGRGVLFGQERRADCLPGALDCCPAGDICFRQGALPVLSSAGQALLSHPLLREMVRRREERSYPTEALVRWQAPATGRVELSGTLRRLRAAPAGGDGVQLQVYRQLPGEAPVLLHSVAVGPLESTPKGLSLPALEVATGDAVFFKLSSGADIPLGREGSRSMGLDEVALEPELRYSHFCTSRGRGCEPVRAELAQAVDASGHPLVRYALKEDLRVAGSPWMGVQIPLQAEVTLGGIVTKQPTADDVTVCIQLFAADQAMAERPCGPGDLVHRLAWSATGSVPLTLSRRVQPGTMVAFRVESETPVDPAAISWQPRVVYEALCPVGGGACQQPADQERARLDKSAEPLFAIHTPVLDGPPRLFIVPRSGRAVLSSRLRAASGAGPLFVAIHRGSERLLKASGSHAEQVEVSVTAGQPLLVRAYSQRAESYSWDVELRFPGAGPAGADVTYRVEDKNRAVQQGAQPFSGGYRGFSVGEWNGRETFDPRRILAFNSGDWEGLSPEEYQQRLKERLSDPDSVESRSLQLFAPLLPRQGGGVLTDGAAWVSADGLTFVARGRAHAARRLMREPAEAMAGDPLASALDGVVRSSISETTGVNLGLNTPYFGLGLAGSAGPTTSVMEALDMNGDGLIDTVVAGEVRLTRPGDYSPGAVFPLGGLLRRSRGLSLLFSPSSGGLPQRQGGPGAQPRQVGATDVVSAVAGLVLGQHSLGVGRDEVEEDLLDINGDGLPDRVERRADGSRFRVWLNLGNRFAEQADELPAADWQTQVDAFFLNGVQEQVRQGIQRVAGVQWPQVLHTSALRHTTTLTMMSSWGLSFGVGSGASTGLSYQGSVARTSVDLVDVNGDGLPDLVKKGAFDGGLRVQLNLGSGFAPEEEWAMPAWGAVPGSRLRLVLDNRNLSEALLSLGLGRGGEVDGLALSASYSDPFSWGASAGIGLDVSWLCPLCPAVVVEKSYSESQSRSGLELGLQDLDGDGAADHVLKNSETPDVIWARMGQVGAARAGLLKSVSRPLGGSFEIAYERVGNTVALPQSRWVMSEVVVRDGRGAAAPGLAVGHDFRTRLSYEDGYYDRVEREFNGFARVVRQSGDREVGGDGRRVEQTFHNRDYSLRGLLAREVLTDKEGRVFSRVTNEYVDGVLGVAPAPCQERLPHPLSTQGQACTLEFPQLVQVAREECEGGSTCQRSSQRYTYEPLYGNVVSVEDLGEEGAADDVLTEVSYPAPGSRLAERYMVGLPLALTVRDRAGRVLRYRRGEFDDRGNLTRLLAQVDEQRLAETRLEWTPKGNLKRVEGPPNEAGQRYAVEYEYDPDTETYVTGTRDSFGLSSSAVYDLRFGIPVRTTDAKENTSRQVVDGFGRVTDVYGPGDALGDRPSLHFEYHPEARPASALTEHKLPPGGTPKATLDTVLFVDGLGRVLQTKKDAEVDGQGVGHAVSGKVLFDVAGRVARQGQPVFSRGARLAFVDQELVHPTVTSYDIRDRVVRTVGADGTLSTREYTLVSLEPQGPVRLALTLTDGNGHVRVAYQDMAERTVAVEERIEGRRLLTRYEHSPLGEVTDVVDAAGNRTEAAYDMLGQRTRLRTPDTGLSEYVYDLAGNLVALWDPNLRASGQPIRYQYDFNRLRLIDYPRSEDVRFTYGGPGKRPENDAGRLREVEDEVGRETRKYGRLGEVVEVTRVVRPLQPGDRPRTFTTRFEQDSLGRMLSLTYPDGEVVSYRYDAGGLLRSTVGERPATRHNPAEREVYLASMRYDLFGQRTRMELGNGVVTDYRYDEKTRWLKSLRTVAPAGRVL